MRTKTWFAKEIMNNKKITKMLKKVAVSAVLGLSAAAPLAVTAQSASAATYTASKYFPGESADTDNAYEDSNNAAYFRNFKNRSANIYVKNKKLKKIYQKAAKTWAPVFKFKFVKSGKHANFNSSKYANIIVKKDGGSKQNWATVNKLQFMPGSMKNLKKMNKEFPAELKMSWYNTYVDGKIVNYKKWAANERKTVTGKGHYIMPQHNHASEIGMWIPSISDARKNSWNHYITIASGTRRLTQTQQLKNARAILGEVIGLGDASENQGSQSDLDHVDWIYAHPWNGSNYYWDNRTLES